METQKKRLNLNVSFFGYVENNVIDTVDVLTTIQELKLKQNIIRAIVRVLSFDEKILKEQDTCWLSFIPIKNQEQKIRIALATESHHHTPVKWISDTTLEIIIHPDKKTVKRNY